MGWSGHRADPGRARIKATPRSELDIESLSQPRNTENTCMGWQVGSANKVLVAKPGELSAIFETHTVKEENRLLQVVL